MVDEWDAVSRERARVKGTTLPRSKREFRSKSRYYTHSLVLGTLVSVSSSVFLRLCAKFVLW